MDCVIRDLARSIGICATLLIATLAHAASLSGEQEKTVRAATFEVVLRKQDNDPLTYEKPLPLDLIPYVIRSDRYWSVGTAFAIAPNTYVSAAHVLLAGVGSQFGEPALRDAAGNVHPVDQVLKFSAHEDFVVFSVSGGSDVAPLPVSREYRIDDTVFAVGNALGEGIVIRDGLLTSETPEDQDGRWKWLRFSAAASPGNSGGPLLDSAGRVIGIVRAKSPNENLNYALPISHALDAGAEARFELRYSIKLPTARETQVASLKTQFALPKRFADFARTYRETLLDATRRDQQQLLASLAPKLFPRGNSGKLLATVYDSPRPSFVQQDQNDAWDAVAASDLGEQTLPGDGLISTGAALGVQVFRLRRPNSATDGKFYDDPGDFMDMLLKGLKFERTVGTQQVRITSLGHSPQRQVLDDHYGRRWQVTAWPLGYIDSFVICYALPTPEGYVGMVQMVPSAGVDVFHEYVKLLADAVEVNYSGSLEQWRAFLARRDLRPKLFEHVDLAFDDKQGLRYQSARLNLQMPADLTALTSKSELELHTAYIVTGGQTSWDVAALYLFKDNNRHTYIGLQRYIKPADESARDLLETWNQLRTHGPGYNRVAGHDAEFRNYWIHDVLSAPLPKSPGLDPDASVLYDVFYGTDASSYPRDIEEVERRLIQATHILER